MLKLALLCRLDNLVMGVHCFLQLAPKIFHVLLKGVDLAQPLFLYFPQPLLFFSQSDDFKAVLL